MRRTTTVNEVDTGWIQWGTTSKCRIKEMPAPLANPRSFVSRMEVGAVRLQGTGVVLDKSRPQINQAPPPAGCSTTPHTQRSHKPTTHNPQPTTTHATRPYDTHDEVVRKVTITDNTSNQTRNVAEASSPLFSSLFLSHVRAANPTLSQIEPPFSALQPASGSALQVESCMQHISVRITEVNSDMSQNGASRHKAAR